MTTTIPERVPLGAPTLNRDWYLDVDTASSATAPTWIGVFGITNFQPAVNATTQDAGDYDSGGWGATARTAMDWSVVASVLRKLQQDVTPVAYDPGQEFLRLASTEFGDASQVHIRFYKNDDAKVEAYEGWVDVQWAPQGGDRTGLDSVQVTLNGQGERKSIPFPSSAAAWQASHAYALNDEVTVSGGAVLKATTAGTSGTTEPVAPGAVGGTVTDNTVTWTRVS